MWMFFGLETYVYKNLYSVRLVFFLMFYFYIISPTCFSSLLLQYLVERFSLFFLFLFFFRSFTQLLRLRRARLPAGAGPGELRVRPHPHDARPARHPRQLLPLLRVHGGAAIHVLPRSEAHRCVVRNLQFTAIVFPCAVALDDEP